MSDRDLDALRLLRREHASVPSAARERGRRRLEQLLDRRSGDQLRRASGRLARRALGFVAAGIVLALALAAGGLVVLGHGPRRSNTDSPASIAQRPATRASLVAMLGVLRRPQTDAERALVHRPATDRYAALPRFSDPGSVRILGARAHGRDVFLYLQGASVCVYYPDVEGGGIGCATAPQLERNRTMGTLGSEVFGLVPDVVSQVELSFPDGQVSIAARDNFWRARLDRATRTAIVWKDAQGREVDPGNAHPTGLGPAPTPPNVSVTTTELRGPVEVLPGHRVRFIPNTGPYRYEIALRCERSGFDGAITKRLPAGQVATVRLNLAPARDQCPGSHVFAGEITKLLPQEAHGPVRVHGKLRFHVIVLGRFRLSR
jgi:hypothetical protein